MFSTTPEKILDLNLLPFCVGPFKTYDKYLLWKLSSMRFGEIFQLPIFSAFKVMRLAEGFILENTSTGQLWAAVPQDYAQILDFVETQGVQKTTLAERTIIRHLLTRRLWMQGKSEREVARHLKISLGRAKAMLELARLDVAALAS